MRFFLTILPFGVFLSLLLFLTYEIVVAIPIVLLAVAYIYAFLCIYSLYDKIKIERRARLNKEEIHLDDRL